MVSQMALMSLVIVLKGPPCGQFGFPHTCQLPQLTHKRAPQEPQIQSDMDVTSSQIFAIRKEYITILQFVLRISRQTKP